MKVRDYLNQLPEPHRSRALKYENEDFYKEVDSLKRAVYIFEYWVNTKEGEDYWVEVSLCDYSKALEICPITEDERQLIKPTNFIDIVSDKISGFESTAREQIKNRVELEKEFDNKLVELFVNRSIDWLYLQYQIYGYLTEDMVKKAKDKLAQ